MSFSKYGLRLEANTRVDGLHVEARAEERTENRKDPRGGIGELSAAMLY